MDQRDIRLEEIEKRRKELYSIITEKDKNWDFSRDWYDYQEYLSKEHDELDSLSREERMIMPYTLKDIPKCGNVMTLEHFIECVNDGGFIDYDGSGNYLEFDKMTNISIYPSDVEFGLIRKQFDKIIWFNK